MTPAGATASPSSSRLRSDAVYLPAAGIAFAWTAFTRIRALDDAGVARTIVGLVISLVIWTLIGVTSRWVAREARRHNQAAEWAPAVFLLWIVAFPLYVALTADMKEGRRGILPQSWRKSVWYPRALLAVGVYAWAWMLWLDVLKLAR